MIWLGVGEVVRNNWLVSVWVLVLVLLTALGSCSKPNDSGPPDPLDGLTLKGHRRSTLVDLAGNQGPFLERMKWSFYGGIYRLEIWTETEVEMPWPEAVPRWLEMGSYRLMGHEEQQDRYFYRIERDGGKAWSYALKTRVDLEPGMSDMVFRPGNKGGADVCVWGDQMYDVERTPR